jgi:cellulose synthase/poly-beta-1,6-N-acetylglucosamine synthase-like glycosyltransferase
MVYLYKRNKKECESLPEMAYTLKTKGLPVVTVQLPIYNEFYVVDRLIETTCKLEYPKSLLQIQLLDDSTDETKEKSAKLVKEYQKAGFWIEHIHRTDRVGHKAGALENGMLTAKGEFLAIFDADFLPSPDFLLKTLPYFQDREIGMVQTRWGHINGDYNLLTKAQSFGIDGHFMIEQVARNGSGLWMNFNGTSGIWRKSCIETSGGWEHDTLTEDFDLSYRAELKGWKFRYFYNIVSPAEIPATISSYKSQQFRWCKGSIQTGMKLASRILKADLPSSIRWEAFTHMFNYSVHPLMILNILFTGPLLLLQYWTPYKLEDMPFEILLGSATVLSIGSMGPVFFYAYSQRELHPNDWMSKLKYLPFMIMLGTGIAISNTRGWIEAVMGIPSGFKRTPKLRIESTNDSLKDRMKYTVPLDKNVWLELLMGTYCVFCIYLSILMNKPYMIGFMTLYALGFYFVAFKSFQESLWNWEWSGSRKTSSLPS